MLSAGDCRENLNNSWKNDTVYFYKLPEGLLKLIIIPRQYRQSPVKFENIPVSEYKLVYKNNFGQSAAKKIMLTDRAVNSIFLCPDKLVDYKQHTLAKLRDNDTIAINFQSLGCFHSAAFKIVIRKRSDRFLAGLYTVNLDYETAEDGKILYYREDSLVKEVSLTDENIQDFIRFENEINFINDKGRCTTTDWYIIKSKYLDIKATDGSCRWNGFYFLRKSFFGDEE